MPHIFLFLILIPIAYALTLAIEYLSDKLLLSKKADFDEWEIVYKPPLCPRMLLLLAVYACLAVGCLHSATPMGKLLSSFFLVNLLVISIIDFKYQFIFDEQNLLLASMALLKINSFSYGWKEPVIASATAFVIMLVICFLSRGALGGGDVKLMAAVGLWLGAWATLEAFMYGILLGGLAAAVMLVVTKKGRRDFFAYGPYLCLGAAYGWYLVAKSW